MADTTEVYTNSTINVDDITIVGGDRAPVGRYRAHLVACEGKEPDAPASPYVNAVTEITSAGEWQFSEFPIRFYTKVTKKTKNGRTSMYSSGIADIILACAAVGNPLTEKERQTFPMDPVKIANLFAKKIGNRPFDIKVYEESYTDKTTGEQKTVRKAAIVRVIPPPVVAADTETPPPAAAEAAVDDDE